MCQVPVTMYRAEKYAIPRQTLQDDTFVFFLKNFGCRRKVYNLYVDLIYKKLEKSGYTSGDDIPKITFPEVIVFKKAGGG